MSIDNDAVQYPTEFLNSLQPTGLPTHLLQLKIGMSLIVLRNLALGLANGTRVILIAMKDKCLHIKIATGPKEGQLMFLPKIPLTPSATDLSFSFTRLQFPVKHSFAVTINKSQGRTLRTCGLDLQGPCFSHGQFYVGCSRISTPGNLFILADTTTKNIVYPEVITINQ